MNGAARVAGLRSERRQGDAQPLDRARDREGRARDHRGDRGLQFNEAAGAAYRFVWNVYCDWYLELAKPVLTGPDGAAKDETRAMAAWVRDEILKLLHPFMPFITEELWRVTAEQGPKRDGAAGAGEWPTLDGLDDDKAEAEIGWVIDLVTAIRSVRVGDEHHRADAAGAGRRVAPRRRRARERWAEFVKRLARVSDISFADDARRKARCSLLVRGEVAALPLKGVIDLAAERARLDKEMAEGRGRHQARRRQARQSEIRRQRAPRRSSRARGRSARRPKAAAQKILEALERLNSAK